MQIGSVRANLGKSGRACVFSCWCVLHLVWAEMDRNGHLIYLLDGCVFACRSRLIRQGWVIYVVGGYIIMCMQVK